jgi:hypothetical protein
MVTCSKEGDGHLNVKLELPFLIDETQNLELASGTEGCLTWIINVRPYMNPKQIQREKGYGTSATASCQKWSNMLIFR